MEFQLQTDLSTALPATIEFNFDSLKAEINANLERYRGMVVTEESIKVAKADRAKLNKLREAMDKKRAEIKKAYLVPYITFEAQVKELLALVGEPIGEIDTQLKAFDEKRRQEKRAAIEHFYKNNAGDLRELVPLDKILNPKWVNQKPSTMEITQELLASLGTIRNDLGIIRAMKLDFEDQIVDKYLDTLSMSEALAEKARLEQQKKALKAVVGFGGGVAPAVPEKPREAPRSPQGSVDMEAIDFRVYVTAEEKALMRQFLKDNGIQYTKVPTDTEGRIMQWQQPKTA